MRIFRAVPPHRTFLTVALLLAAGAAQAELAVETWGVARQCTHAGTVKIAKADEEAAVIRIDLSALRKSAKIRRARLLVGREPIDGSDAEAAVSCEVFSLTAPYQAGAPRLDSRRITHLNTMTPGAGSDHDYDQCDAGPFPCRTKH